MDVFRFTENSRGVLSDGEIREVKTTICTQGSLQGWYLTSEGSLVIWSSDAVHTVVGLIADAAEINQTESIRVAA